jgi:hypothetical protein
MRNACTSARNASIDPSKRHMSAWISKSDVFMDAA